MTIIKTIVKFITCNRCMADDEDLNDILICHTCQACFDVVQCNDKNCSIPRYYVSRAFPQEFNEINIVKRKYYTFNRDDEIDQPFIICAPCYSKYKTNSIINTKGQILKRLKKENIGRTIYTIQNFGVDDYTLIDRTL